MLVRQHIGIPMGTNSGVFLAKYYLFTYELQFVRALVDNKCFDLLTIFALTKRYIDDCLSLNNPHFQKFALKSQDEVVENGIHGIYPSCLSLNLEQSSFSTIHFLDVQIKRHHKTWYTSIFDKREVPPLNQISNVKFPEMDSFLSDGSKYSVLMGQLHRFARICKRRKDFLSRARQLISYLIANGYKRNILFGKTLVFMRKFDFLYDVKNVREFVFRLFASVARGPSGHH